MISVFPFKLSYTLDFHSQVLKSCFLIFFFFPSALWFPNWYTSSLGILFLYSTSFLHHHPQIHQILKDLSYDRNYGVCLDFLMLTAYTLKAHPSVTIATSVNESYHSLSVYYLSDITLSLNFQIYCYITGTIFISLRYKVCWFDTFLNYKMIITIILGFWEVAWSILHSRNRNAIEDVCTRLIPRAAIKKFPYIWWLKNNRNVFSHSSGSKNSKINMSAKLVPSRAS